MKGTADSF